MSAPGHNSALKVLRAFFRVAAFVFLLATFSYSLEDNGRTWIMWRDATLLAVTLAALALFMAGGWLYTALRLGAAPSEGGAPPPARRFDGKARPYNIWGPMPARSRAGLALAVFLIFGTLGPLNALLTPPTHALRPLDIIISTIGSGGISACIILFGNRKILLVVSLLACLAVLSFPGQIAASLGARPVTTIPFTGGSVTITREQIGDLQAQRAVVAGAGIVLLTLGYVMFIFLLTSEGRHRSRLEAEVSIARGIQESLIPSGEVATEHVQAAGRTVPASEVGGDFFDFLRLRDGRLAVFAADVAGHGVGAGILGAMTKSAFRAHIEGDASPGPMLAHLNATLSQLVQKGMFITAAYLLIDAEGRTARVATAGHPPVVRAGRDGHVEELRTPSLALGIGKASAFQEIEVACTPGDVLLLYTDGLVETVAAGGEQFGTERLKEKLAELRGLPPARLCSGLIQEAAGFRGRRPAADDVTVVAVRIA